MTNRAHVLAATLALSIAVPSIISAKGPADLIVMEKEIELEIDTMTAIRATGTRLALGIAALLAAVESVAPSPVPQPTASPETNTMTDEEAKECREEVFRRRRDLDGGKDCDYEWHHIFPQQFRDDFHKIGIDVDRWTILLCAAEHRGKDAGIHRKDADYNGQWHDFFHQDIFDKPLTDADAKRMAKQAEDLAIEQLNDEGKAGPDYQICPYPK